MIMAITTKDKENVSDFNSPILVVDTDKEIKKESNYLEAMKYVDVLITSHLDGFNAENVTTYGVTPIIYRDTIENAVKELKDCGIKRSLPIGESEGCGGTCGV